MSDIIYKNIADLKIGSHTVPIQLGGNFLILKLEDIKNERVEIDQDAELKKMVSFEQTRQLNKFSTIYYNKVKINIDKVTVSNLDKNDVDLHVKLTDDISLDLKWQTMKDRNNIVDADTETDTVIQMIANSIDTVYSGEEIMTIGNSPKQEVIDFVESLNTDQFGGIVEILSNAPSLSYDVEFNCVECKKDNSLGLSGLIDFFQ